jgi:hypothetical protein
LPPGSCPRSSPGWSCGGRLGTAPPNPFVSETVHLPRPRISASPHRRETPAARRSSSLNPLSTPSTPFTPSTARARAPATARRSGCKRARATPPTHPPLIMFDAEGRRARPGRPPSGDRTGGGREARRGRPTDRQRAVRPAEPWIGGVTVVATGPVRSGQAGSPRRKRRGRWSAVRRGVGSGEGMDAQ